MWQKFKQWWRGEDSADKAVAVSGGEVARRFARETALGAPQQYAHMGWLVDKGVSPVAFARYCTAFAQGIEYVRNTCGTEPKAIVVDDSSVFRGQANVRYNTGSQTIYLSRGKIQGVIALGLIRNPAADPLLLTYEQEAFLSGVEEAYHHYQATAHPQREHLLASLPENGAEYSHENLPIEQDARQFIRRAIREAGLIHNPITTEKVNKDDARWVEDARKQDAEYWRTRVQQPAPSPAQSRGGS